MTRPGLASTDAEPDTDTDTDTDASTGSRLRAPGGLVLLLLSLLWLAREMWAAHASIARNLDDPVVAISSVALALPGVVTASLVAGVAAGLFVALRLAARTRVTDSPTTDGPVADGVLSTGSQAAKDGIADGAVDDPVEEADEPQRSPWPGVAARVARRAAITGGAGLLVGG